MQEYICMHLFADIDIFTHRGQHNCWYNAGHGLPTIWRRWFACFRQLQSPLRNPDTSHDDDDDAHYSNM